MDGRFYRYLRIPFFDDYFLNDLESAVSYRLQNRFFTETTLDRVHNMDIPETMLIPLWQFCVQSKVLLRPQRFSCIGPNVVTSPSQASDINCCTLYFPLFGNDENRSISFTDISGAGHPNVTITPVRGKPILLNHFSNQHVMSNHGNDWLVILAMVFYARYDLVVDLIEKKMLIDSHEILIE